MRYFLITPIIVIAFTCSCLSATEITKERIERDLALEVQLQSAKTIGPGEHIGLDISLVNKSKETTYPIVKPGDGSEVGWREPNVYFSAETQKADGKWENVPTTGYARCGLFDSDWQKDVVHLKPGTSITLKDWLASPSAMFELQQPGQVRLYVHYRYSGGTLGKGKETKAPPALGKMKGIPAFEITSAPIELEVVRPLDIRVKMKSLMKVKRKTTISEVLDIHLVNGSQKPIVVSSPTLSADARLRLEIKGEFPGWPPSLIEQKTTYGMKQELKPGEKVPLLGAGEFANGMDGFWEYPVEDTVKLRAIYYCATWKPASVIISDWVEINVER